MPTIKFNKQQAAIINYQQEYNMMVIAGPGTGKTFVLTQRALFLLQQDKKPLLILTFTNKAANEIKNRLYESYPQNKFTFIGTFHGFCFMVLTSCGIKNKVIDEHQQREIILYFLNKHHLNNSYDRQLVEIFEFWKKTNSFQKIKQQNYFDLVLRSYKQEIIYQLFEWYQQKLQQEKLFDFTDLLIETEKILRTNSQVRSKWQNQYKKILVDEWQDTDFIQYKILQHLAVPNTKKLFVVGDPNQMIYEWRGSYEGIFTDFQTDFTPAVFYLNQTYRLPKQILLHSLQLVGLETKMKTQNDIIGKVFWYDAAGNIEKEMKVICDQIQELISSQQCEYKEILILYRFHSQVDDLLPFLYKYHIPFQIKTQLNLFQRKEIIILLNYLQLAINPYNQKPWKAIINIPKRGFGPKNAEKFYHYLKQNNMHFFDALKTSQTWKDIKKKGDNFLKLAEVINLAHQKYQAGESYDKLAWFLIKQLGLEEFFIKEKHKNVVKYWIKFCDYLKSLANENKFDLADYLKNNFYFHGSVLMHKAVSLSTIHAIKGLEYEHVFLIGFSKNNFPYDDENKRLLYVAFTRAKKNLYLSTSAPASPFFYGLNAVQLDIPTTPYQELINYKIIC